MTHDWTVLDPAIVSGQIADRAGPPDHPLHPHHLPNSGRGPADMLASHRQGGGGGGGLADLLGGGGGGLRADSPQNWITANLEQLTGDVSSFGGGAHFGAGGGNNLIPAFSALGLGGIGGRVGGGNNGLGNLMGGGPSHQPPQRQLSSGNGWGGGSTTATPPPGFSQHRPSAAAGQLHHHYGQAGFGINKNSEAQKIGGREGKLTL